MKKTDVDERYARILATQEYDASVLIDGVSFIPLKYHGDDTGEFTELGRFTNGMLETLP